MKKELRIIMLTIAIIMVSSLSTKAYAADVYIPDANFKAFLVANYDTSEDGEIQESEAEAVTESMWVDFCDIADLTGIAAFINLTYLSCSYNQLTTLDVSANNQ